MNSLTDIKTGTQMCTTLTCVPAGNIGLATAYHRAQNRQAWNKLVGTATSSSGQATWWW